MSYSVVIKNIYIQAGIAKETMQQGFQFLWIDIKTTERIHYFNGSHQISWFLFCICNAFLRSKFCIVLLLRIQKFSFPFYLFFQFIFTGEIEQIFGSKKLFAFIENRIFDYGFIAI